MADYEFPPELLDAQRAYYEADVRVREVTDKLPLASAIVAGEAEITEKQREELETARAERLRWVMEMDENPFWQQPGLDKAAAKKQLQKAAKL